MDESGWGDWGDEYAKYVMVSHQEIERTLRSLKAERELVTAHFNRHILLTCVLEVGEDFVLLDDQPSRELTEKLLAADEVSFESHLQRVTIKFRARKVAVVPYEGGNAYRIPFPVSMLKLQRREHFRVPTPVASPIRCDVPLAEGRRTPMTVVDLSVGGIGILSHGAETELVAGQRYPDCRLHLPNQAPVTVAIEACNTVEVALRSGAKARRTGCCFLNLDTRTETQLQRFILQLERERLSRLR